jgi:hypothetical protein
MIDIQTVGETAGLVWQYLTKHGRTTLIMLERGISAPSETVLMAVGWLAREGKVELSQEKHSVYIQLTEK